MEDPLSPLDTVPPENNDPATVAVICGVLDGVEVVFLVQDSKTPVENTANKRIIKVDLIIVLYVSNPNIKKIFSSSIINLISGVRRIIYNT